MTKIKIIGKFYDNHSLAIINRYLAINMHNKLSGDISIQPLDAPSCENKVSASTIKTLKSIENNEAADIEIRHSYPIMWNWPENKNTKVVYIQPWEFMAIPSEWQYKFDTFADLVITPSEWTANVYKSAGINPDKIRVIPNGYEPSIFYPKNTRTKKTFLFVGCSQFRKGLDILLTAWSKSTNKKDEVQLIVKDTPQIYGKTNLQQEIIQLQYKTKCANIVYDDSVKSEAEMSSLYNSAHYIVHPYRGEGFGMHIQEAMACGAIPIITSGGPTDEFASSAIKINTGKRIVNMYDIFALKPGDSMSHMGQHKWVLEPDVTHLVELIKTAIKSEYKNTEVQLPNTWDIIADKYIETLTTINSEKPERVR